MLLNKKIYLENNLVLAHNNVFIGTFHISLKLNLVIKLILLALIKFTSNIYLSMDLTLTC